MAHEKLDRVLSKIPRLVRIRLVTVNRKRALQLLLALVLVVIGFAVIVSVPWKQIVREVSKPRSDEVLTQLTSPGVVERRTGLSVLRGAGIGRDPRITKALTRVALEDSDPTPRAGALGYLSAPRPAMSDGPVRPRQWLPQETIDAITGILFMPSADPRLTPKVVE